MGWVGVRQAVANLPMAMLASLAQRPTHGFRILLDHGEIGEQGAVSLGAALLEIAQPPHIDAVGLGERGLAQAGLLPGQSHEASAPKLAEFILGIPVTLHKLNAAVVPSPKP